MQEVRIDRAVGLLAACNFPVRGDAHVYSAVRIVQNRIEFTLVSEPGWKFSQHD